MKKTFIVLITLILLLSLVISVYAATRTATHQFPDGTRARAHLNVRSSLSTAITQSGSTSAATVSLQTDYFNTRAYTYHTDNRGNGSSGQITVTFDAPTDCIILFSNSTHRAYNPSWPYWETNLQAPAD